MHTDLATPLPREFKQFRGLHAGTSVIVCGCGSSLSSIVAPERTITIGVNDVGRLFDPDYLVVLNPPSQFTGDRFSYVKESRARAVFTQLDLRCDRAPVVRFGLGQRGGTDLSDARVLPYTRNSPYVAIALAMHMGARRIGILGVDFTDHHFFAETGTHILAGQIHKIEEEYKRLYQSCVQQGIEVFNLSEESRLRAFPASTQEEFVQRSISSNEIPEKKLFFVNYRFQSCGDVFTNGVARAANELGLHWQAADWDNPDLQRRLDEFDPDLLFVVHGRKYSARWTSHPSRFRSAVWLVDEPYEVDDTSRYSALFDFVFVNDPSTLQRHRKAHYLPVCYDPGIHTYTPGKERPHTVGFIGGFSEQRQEALCRLAKHGFLSYVVGPWQTPALRQLCRSSIMSADETAALYQQTRIVVNLFRTKHHYNRQAIPAFSLNPRVYEALACGALVVSEYRPEVDAVCPELPVFRTLEEMEYQVERHLRDPDLLARVRKDCIRRLADHTYTSRLKTALKTVFKAEEPVMISSILPEVETVDALSSSASPVQLPSLMTSDWEGLEDFVQVEPTGDVILRNKSKRQPGSERGLVGKRKQGDLVLEFEVFVEAETTFIAKIHQEDAYDQSANSYHVMWRGTRGYLARHNRVFAKFTLPLGRWVPMSISYSSGVIVVRKSGAEIARASDNTLENGYCFLGVVEGTARLRDVRISTLFSARATAIKQRYEGSHTMPGPRPKVSIVTTVYDRVNYLEQCIQSVKTLSLKDYEHIIVADSPPRGIVEQIEELVARYQEDGKLSFRNLECRSNDWGIAPAAAGLSLARGQYVCFLSDDNGYVPHHFDRLIATLDSDASLGFVYSSCLYAGRGVLNAPVPRPAAIDLGQPLFRRELFDKYLGGTLPFHEFGWDWRMIERFMMSGVTWRHVNDATFIFRLAQYPHLIRSIPATSKIEGTVISYCVACFRPVYAKQLIDDLIRKTGVPCEILIWINLEDPEFDQFIDNRIASGANIRIIGRAPENIGMAAYEHLFQASISDMVVQIDDDVVCVSPNIAETAREIFDRFPSVGMLTADVWQDSYTTGARPPLQNYRLFNREFGLYDGPIDGWFAVYRRSSLSLCGHVSGSRYFPLGCTIKARLAALGQKGLLCSRMKVFHVTGPAYVSHFGMLEKEIAKYRMIGREDQVTWLSQACLPPASELATKITEIKESLLLRPAGAPI